MRNQEYEIIGAAFDLASRLRGCQDAPQVLREQGLIQRMRRLQRVGISVTDGGNVTGPEHSESSSVPKHLSELVEFSHDLMSRLKQIYDSARVPVVIGGNHSISIPSVTSAAEFLKASQGKDAELGLIWIDAHPDLETPDSSGSGNIHGMAAAHLLGYGAEELCALGGFHPKIRPENIIFIGLRDSSFAERLFLKENNITAFTDSDIGELGINEVCKRAFGLLSQKTAGFVVSFDMDVCDPLEAPGVESPERGGLQFREARIIMEFIAKAEKLVSLEIVEVNPRLDIDFTTSKAAIALIEAALGATII
jgi:arginase